MNQLRSCPLQYNYRCVDLDSDILTQMAKSLRIQIRFYIQ